MRRIKKPVARRGDSQTSWDAAKSVTSLRVSQQAIYSLIERYGPMTDEEIQRKLVMPMSPSGARTRRKELVAKNLVRDSGLKGITSSGRKTIKWEVVIDDAGDEVCGDRRFFLGDR